jgi:general L-amino acid transport system substrate-binding protein
MKRYIFVLLLLTAGYFSTPSQGLAYTLQEVIKRGVVHCGVSPGTPGFSSVDADGNWSGFDVDFCRAVAAAVLGDASKVELKPVAANEYFTALLSGDVDLLTRHTAWTFTRDSALPVHFTGVSYFDGLGFLVSEKLGVKKSEDIKKVKVCGPVGESSEEDLREYLDKNKAVYKIVPYETIELAVRGFLNDSCELLSLPKSQLQGIYLEMDRKEDALVLDDVITKKPLGPVVRNGDDGWFTIIRWVLFAMINGEELGISSENIDEMKISLKLDVKRFFGLQGSGGKGLGLQNDWAAQIIRQVGNYGEVFQRNLGEGTPLNLERGYNRLWSDGGLIYAPPLR